MTFNLSKLVLQSASCSIECFDIRGQYDCSAMIHVCIFISLPFFCYDVCVCMSTQTLSKAKETAVPQRKDDEDREKGRRFFRFEFCSYPFLQIITSTHSLGHFTRCQYTSNEKKCFPVFDNNKHQETHSCILIVAAKFFTIAFTVLPCNYKD